jgi:hypothetical protein
MEPLVFKGVEPKGALLALLWAALFCFTATLFFFKLGSYQTLTLTEGYVAVPAREMLRIGDWLVPRFGGSPRLEKPPLAYWLVASLGWLRGEINEFIVRLPAALASLCLVGLMGLWGSSMEKQSSTGNLELQAHHTIRIPSVQLHRQRPLSDRENAYVHGSPNAPHYTAYARIGYVLADW